MPRITELYAFISTGQDPDDEGVIAARINPSTWMPLVGADKERIESLRPLVQAMVNELKVPIKLVKFSKRTDLEDLQFQANVQP